MKKINFAVENLSTVANTKVNAIFVEQVKEAFLMFPKSVTMRYKQNYMGQLVISLTVTYASGMSQHLEGTADVELISVILRSMGKDNSGWSDYKAEEHEIEVAAEGENMVLELFKQYFASTMHRFIESDWYSNQGDRYRCLTFTPSYNMNVKFCLKATEEVNELIREACKPEWMKKAESEQQAAA